MQEVPRMDIPRKRDVITRICWMEHDWIIVESTCCIVRQIVREAMENDEIRQTYCRICLVKSETTNSCVIVQYICMTSVLCKYPHPPQAQRSALIHSWEPAMVKTFARPLASRLYKSVIDHCTSSGKSQWRQRKSSTSTTCVHQAHLSYQSLLMSHRYPPLGFGFTSLSIHNQFGTRKPVDGWSVLIGGRVAVSTRSN